MEEPGGLQSMGLLESDMTERLHFHFSLSCIGEGNGNPLQCSCLENPKDRGAWWASVYGVAQSWTWLKWRSSSSSAKHLIWSVLSECVIVAYNKYYVFGFLHVPGTKLQKSNFLSDERHKDVFVMLMRWLGKLSGNLNMRAACQGTSPVIWKLKLFWPPE